MKKLGLAYLHVVDHSSLGMLPVPQSVKDKIHDAFGGTIILAGGNDRARAEAALAEGRRDLFGFARAFIANPRLPSKLRDGLPLAQPDFATFYTPDEKGYTDYTA
jgi:N-ethylmaleimide reductase